MISHLAKLGVDVPDGFATTAQAYRDFLQHEGLAARISQGAGDARRRRRRERSRASARDPPVDPGHAVSAAARARDPRIVRAHERRARHRRRRALLGDRRRSAGRIVRRSAGNVPQRARPRCAAQVRARSVRLAVQRSRDRLSRAPGLRPRPGRALGGHPVHGALAISARAASCSRSTRTPASATSSSSRRRTGSAKPSCRAP